MSTRLLNTEKELLLMIAQGNETAFRELFNQYYQKIYSLGMHITRSEMLAQEIVQDVFIKVWEKRTQLIEINYINSWLRTVTRNVCLDYLRSLTIERLALNKFANKKPAYSSSPEIDCIYKEYEKMLENAIKELTPQQQKVYLLSRKHGLKQSEIAQQLGISVYTVKEYMKLALRSIRQNLEQKIDLVVTAAVIIHLV